MVFGERRGAGMSAPPERGQPWRGMAQHDTVGGSVRQKRRVAAASGGSPLRREGGGYHGGERVVRKLRKATRSETTRAKQ